MTVYPTLNGPFLNKVFMRWGFWGNQDQKRGWDVDLRCRCQNSWAITNADANVFVTCMAACITVAFGPTLFAQFKACQWKQQDIFSREVVCTEELVITFKFPQSHFILPLDNTRLSLLMLKLCNNPHICLHALAIFAQPNLAFILATQHDLSH